MGDNAVVPVLFLVAVFTRYQIGLVSVFLVSIVPPFFVSFPPFSPKGGLCISKRGALAPLLRKKGAIAPFLMPKYTDRVFHQYQYGKYQEILTNTNQKISIQ